MYGSKRVFRILSSICAIVLSSGMLVSSIIALSGDYFDEIILLIYVSILLISIASLTISILLCVNKSSKAMAITLIVFSGIFVLFDLLDIMIMNNPYSVLNFMFWLATLGFLCVFLALKEGVPPPQTTYIRSAYDAPDSFPPATPQRTPNAIENKIAILDKLKAEGKLTEEEYKNLLLDELKK